MFHRISPDMRARMATLEAVDARDRVDSTPKEKRLRQIPPETGRFLALLAAGAPPGGCLEVGTSGGYSGLWLALACRERQSRLVTFELDPRKVHLAHETFSAAGVEPWVEVVEGDALALLPAYSQVSFCFLDTEKELYMPCYELVIPRLVAGGWLAADNVISHAANLNDFLTRAMTDQRVDATVVPVGKGVLLCRKV
jgi:caffeoyl-CoA O-methyltransferase